MIVQPYLNFDGRCDEALAFYREALGAEVLGVRRFKDAPPGDYAPPADHAEKVMHAAFQVGETMLFASDGRCLGKEQFSGMALTLTVKDEAAADKAFGALSAGGTVRMPMAKTFFSAKFGMLADKFGVHWMVMVQP
jgi:PhnB protein